MSFRQTLNEKIEERNDELHKLRKKTTTTVLVLTHIKEKLHAMQQGSAVLRSHLTEQERKVQVCVREESGFQKRGRAWRVLELNLKCARMDGAEDQAASISTG